MARRFGPGFVATADQGARLEFKRRRLGRFWDVRYSPAREAVKLAQQYRTEFVPPSNPVLLLSGDRDGELVTLHPHNLDATSPRFLQPRYETIRTISLEGFGFLEEIDDLDGVTSYLERLPTGFVRDPYYGLGLNFDIRLIVETIEELNLTDLRMVRGARGDAAVNGNSYVIPFALFDKVRRDIGRVHAKALAAARIEKGARLHDKLLTPIDAQTYPLIGQPYEPDAVVRAVGDGLRRGLTLSSADAAILVEATASMIGEVAQREPVQLLKLTEAVETVTLEAMIAHMRARVRANHGEESWQQFLTANAFILRLAFGVPVLLFEGQATVGGRTYNGSGDKRSDFLMQAAKTGNLSIVEIKTPQTELLAKREYRGGIYPPHQELSGAVAQVLDQRWQLQQNNVGLANAHWRNSAGKAPDRGPRPETYAVHCVVIIGTSPKEPNLQKSFELYRNGLNEVLILTFDELLLKLVTLLQILKDPNATKLIAPTVTVMKPKSRKKRGPGRQRR
ncbi:MAG TPA: Shedu immune nuclease family protein [Allosphingosinicella sp.]|jgi:hypothetical protein